MNQSEIQRYKTHGKEFCWCRLVHSREIYLVATAIIARLASFIECRINPVVQRSISTNSVQTVISDSVFIDFLTRGQLPAAWCARLWWHQNGTSARLLARFGSQKNRQMKRKGDLLSEYGAGYSTRVGKKVKKSNVKNSERESTRYLQWKNSIFTEFEEDLSWSSILTKTRPIWSLTLSTNWSISLIQYSHGGK